MNPTTTTTHEFKVGDTVRRTGSARLSTAYAVGTNAFEVAKLRENGYVVDGHGKGHDPENLELVTASPDTGPFRLGELVRRANNNNVSAYSVGREPFEVCGLWREYVVDENGAHHSATNLERVARTEITATPERKLGETPESFVVNTLGTIEHIAIDDPRIAWIWADLATYADGENWCGHYDKLARAVGIPGRKQKFSGAITLAGTQRLRFDNIEADSQADAERLFREQLAAELVAA